MINSKTTHLREIFKKLILSIPIFSDFLKKRSKHYKKFGRPRAFSNEELKRFSHLFTGDVVNISGWNDLDKQGMLYRDYFNNKKDYFISNYKEDQKGIQGFENEFYLDLESDLDPNLKNSFEVVFCHTVLEHVFDFSKAFKNLSEISKDILIIVVPFLQQMHGSGYKDYWRFTPEALKKLYLNNGFTPRYISANNDDKASIYLFSIGYKNRKWDKEIPEKFIDRIDPNLELGSNNYSNALGAKIV